MNQAKKSKLYFLIPALCAAIIDISVTVIHQPIEYWNGNLNTANEANPIGGFMMENHISGLFVISGLWLILIGLLGYYLPKGLSKIFLLFVVIAHSFGASTWISSNYGFWWAMVLILLNTILYISFNDPKYYNKTKKAAHNNV